MKFKDLRTGDVMNLMGTQSVLLAIERPHPIRIGYWMFVWYVINERRMSFDALHPEYDLIPGSTVHQDGFYNLQMAITTLSKEAR